MLLWCCFCPSGVEDDTAHCPDTVSPIPCWKAPLADFRPTQPTTNSTTWTSTSRSFSDHTETAKPGFPPELSSVVYRCSTIANDIYTDTQNVVSIDNPRVDWTKRSAHIQHLGTQDREMLPSKSAVERNNPPPRRKACAACIKAKRRCTQEYPVCQRCSQRDLDCKYPVGRVPKRPQPASNHSSTPTSVLAFSGDLLPPDYVQPIIADSPWDGMSWTTPALSSWPDTQLYTQQTELLSMIAQPDQMASTGNFFDFNDFGIVPEEPGLDTTNSSHQSSDDSPPLLLNVPVARAIYNMTVAAPLACLSSAAATSWAIKNRLAFSIEKIRDAPRQMVMENQTPWSHPLLYESSMPQSMQDAYSSCALYIAKNPINSEIIFRNIDSRVKELVDSPIPVEDVRELLARVQALMLYQIMRVLDVDYRRFDVADEATGSLEEATGSLEEATLALMEHIVFEEGTFPDDQPGVGNGRSRKVECTKSEDQVLPLYPLDTTRQFWETWVFQESARKTFLMVWLFVRTYRLLQGHVPKNCDGKMGLNFSFTLSEHLWAAKDPLSFALAWGEGRKWSILNANFTSVLNQARGDDVDVFSKMVMTTMWGISETKGWLITTGGDL
ncbi:hypothetical protein QBC35DRAFT_495403 [Podospora australis]|uniref:Zn(2)-C6 fungal-type domain-containing protein n=1 Tax=Podospora australis TaxID=1536484 RepID=A0AAN7AHE6_9PEZI|nr:hypothetical protein QBC35DRAFT_495403 [Podospora australis]